MVRAALLPVVGLMLSLLGAGCGGDLEVGSDVLWSARFETQTFDEYLAFAGGGPSASSPASSVVVSGERAHRGAFAAKLSVDAAPGAPQQNVGLARDGELPTEAYYSAWYYLPRSIGVGTYWVIFKLRTRAVAADPATDAELFDLNLANLASGEMTLRLYDHRNGDIPLDAPDVVVPVGVWFQVEAFYRNAPDASGRLTLWLDGRQIADVQGRPTGLTPWMAWDAGSVGLDLTPGQAVLYIDDCAISRTRVGPTGILTP